jgi:hypothetical protein
MPRTNPVATFAKVTSKLLAQRKKHLAIVAKSSAKVAEIEGMFSEFGITLDGGKPTANGKQRGRKAGRRKRGVFKETADEFILGLLKGGKSLSTAELGKAWKKAGRGGKADNTLTKLVHARQLKRQKAKEGKGSVYSAA